MGYTAGDPSVGPHATERGDTPRDETIKADLRRIRVQRLYLSDQAVRIWLIPRQQMRGAPGVLESWSLFGPRLRNSGPPPLG